MINNNTTDAQTQLETLASDLKEMTKRLKRLTRDLKTVKANEKKGVYKNASIFVNHRAIIANQLSDLAGHAYGFSQVTLEAVNQTVTDEGNTLADIVSHLIATR